MTITLSRARVAGSRIVFRGEPTPDLVAFYRSLPRAAETLCCPACRSGNTYTVPGVAALLGVKGLCCRDCGRKFTVAQSQSSAWACDATPGAAWRIMGQSGIDDQDGIPPLAEKLQGVLDPCRIETGQPAIRRTDAWDHQVEAYRFALPRPATLLEMGMGTGKTKVAIDLAANWGCERVLVLCPKSVMDVWEHEIGVHAAHAPRLLVLHKGSVKKKMEAADQWLDWAGPAVIVLNYEAARASAFAEWSLAQQWDLVILDESHQGKAPASVTARYLEKLGRRATRRLCLTGTPMPNGPLDIFSQLRFLDPGLFGTSFCWFRDHYATMGGYEEREIVAYRNVDEMQRLMSLITFRCGDEVLDLPPVQDHYRRFDLCAKARKHYNELETELVTEIDAGEVTCANALVRLLRLQQITSGYLAVEGSPPESIDTGKATLLAELLEDIGPDERVVVACKFLHDLDVVRQVADALGRGYGEISGRYNDYRAWKAGHFDAKPCNVLGTQIQAGSLGIDLSEARYAIAYSVGFSLGDWLQWRKRTDRPGQTRGVHYYHLIGRDTVDEAVYGALRKKQQVVEAVLSGLTKGD